MNELITVLSLLGLAQVLSWTLRAADEVVHHCRLLRGGRPTWRR